MRITLAASLLLALAACGDKDTKAPAGSSFGEVLPGSASDAMLPYDTASSAPPLEAPGANVPADTGGSQGDVVPADNGTDAAPEPEPS